jgi:hypothetical protein
MQKKRAAQTGQLPFYNIVNHFYLTTVICFDWVKFGVSIVYM